ncbi:MAG: tetratricopeptide repeat protein [bacterium]|nr:tetratricopeptide repeat protein [bacterium]
MRKQIRLKDILFSASVPESVFNAASDFVTLEEYGKAQSLIEESWLGSIVDIGSTVVSGDRLLSLYAGILLATKEYEKLADFFLSTDDLEEFPKLYLVKIKLLGFNGQIEEAIERCSAFIDSHDNPIDWLVADYLSFRGSAYYRFGNLQASQDDLEISFSLFKLQNNYFSMGVSANYKGLLQRQLGNFSASELWLTRALDSFASLNLPRKQSMVLLNLGVTHYKSGNLKAATTSLNKSLKIGKEGNWTHRMLFPNIALGNVQRMKQQYKSARRHLHTAYQQAQDLGYPREEALALEFLGDVYRDENKTTDAQRFYSRAMAIGQSIAPEGDIVMELFRRQGELLFAENKPAEAIAELNKSIKLAQAMGDRFEEAVALRILAEIKLEAGRYTKAEELITESVDILKDIDSRYELSLSLSTFVELKMRQVNRSDSSLPPALLLTQAWGHATKALDHAIFTGAKSLIASCQKDLKKVSDQRSIQERADRKQLAVSGNKTRNTYKPSQSIIHQSQKMREAVDLTDMFAQTEEPVLISGPTGTGKELIAKRLHMNSNRAENKLVSVNVTTLPATMFEREMFGHVRGSFSGADRDGKGFVGEAEGGTLFLDEIGELSLEMQPKLLRLLQEGTYQTLGDPTEKTADIRIVAATNASLPEMVKAGQFREDLYYRLCVLDLNLPALKERDGDVLVLLRHFLSEAAGRAVELSSYFETTSLQHLQDYHWPGNVRELELFARRVHVQMKTRGEIHLQLNNEDGVALDVWGPNLTFNKSKNEKKLAMEAASGNANQEAVQGFNRADERERIAFVLEQCNGNRIDAAVRLGMSRTTLYRRIKRFGL